MNGLSILAVVVGVTIAGLVATHVFSKDTGRRARAREMLRLLLRRY